MKEKYQERATDWD